MRTGATSGVLTAACLILAAAGADAQSSATGQKLAQQYCVTCHVIAPSGQGSWTDAPPFDVIANRPDETVAKLSAFIQKPHMHMLNTGRPRAEADAIAVYISSLHKN